MKKVFLKKTSNNYYQSISNFILITIIAIATCSCSKSDDDSVVIKKLSQEIKDLVYFRGEETAPIVLINAQSGPDTQLSTQEVDLFFQSYDTTGILMANVHQAQTLNPSIVTTNDITLEEAINYNAESVETLYKVIKHFKDEGRTVYVLGVSFGAFVTQELIAKKGISVADKYLIMTGRLDINNAIWQAAAEGKEAYFENGITPIIDPEPQTDVFDRNLSKIVAGLGMNRYTESLNKYNSLSSITYIYGTTDEAVGSLTAEEVQFLESKNANIITGSGNHTDTFQDYIIQGLDVAFGF